ncbi:hypothetical protein BDW74DRAFT_161587 [Aspergillus multicolor]|uniref:uncharacterized protein n=1 Tax=Aspergillus multicolor TaxID=41759 RepID=UPI003CCD144E
MSNIFMLYLAVASTFFLLFFHVSLIWNWEARFDLIWSFLRGVINGRHHNVNMLNCFHNVHGAH